MPLDESKLQKLDRLLQLLDPTNSLTKRDFTESFSKVVNLVLAVQKNQQEAIQDLQRTYANLNEKLRTDHTNSLTELKTRTNQLFVGERLDSMTGEQRKNMGEIKQMIIDTINRKLGEVDFKMSKVKSGEPGVPGIPGLPGKDAEFPAELRKQLDEFMSKPAGPRRVLAGPSANAVLVEDLSSLVNGQRRRFSTPSYSRALLLISSQFPFIFRPVVDFESGNGVITFTSQSPTLVSGQSLLFLYKK